MDEITLITPRLNIRHLTFDDAAFTYELVNEPSYIESIRNQNVHTLADAKCYLQNGPIHSYEANGFGLYAVCLKGSDAPIGMCGLLARPNLPSPDIGYAFLSATHGKGYATEACVAVIQDAKNRLKLKEVVAVTSPQNMVSRRVLEKLGFAEKGQITLYEQANIYYVKQL